MPIQIGMRATAKRTGGTGAFLRDRWQKMVGLILLQEKEMELGQALVMSRG